MAKDRNVIDVTMVKDEIIPTLVNASSKLITLYNITKEIGIKNSDIPVDYIYKNDFLLFIDDLEFYSKDLIRIKDNLNGGLEIVNKTAVDNPIFKDVTINTPVKRTTIAGKGWSTIGQGGAAITEGLVWSVENAGKGLMTLGGYILSPFALAVDLTGSIFGADINAYKSLWEYEAPVLEHDYTKDYHDWYYSNDNTELMNEYSSFSNDSVTYEALKSGGKVMGTMIMAYGSSSIAGAATPGALSSVTVFGTPLTTVLTSAGTGFITGVGESITPEMNKNYIIFDYGGEEQTFQIDSEKFKKIKNLKDGQKTSFTQTYVKSDGSKYDVTYYVLKSGDKYLLLDENGNTFDIKDLQERDINKALGASALQGAYSGVSYGAGAMVNAAQFNSIIPQSFSPFAKELLRSSCRVVIDGATGAVDPLASAAIDSMVYGKNFEQSFEEQGGFGGMYESAVTSMVFSAASEISELGPKHTVLKVEEKVKNGLEIDKSLQSSLRHLTVGDLQQVINDATEKGILNDILPYLDKSKITSKKVLRMVNAKARQIIDSYYATDTKVIDALYKVTDTSYKVSDLSYDTKISTDSKVLKVSDIDYDGKYSFKSTNSSYDTKISTDSKVSKVSDVSYDGKSSYKVTDSSSIPSKTSVDSDYKVRDLGKSVSSKVGDSKISGDDVQVEKTIELDKLNSTQNPFQESLDRMSNAKVYSDDIEVAIDYKDKTQYLFTRLKQITFEKLDLLVKSTGDSSLIEYYNKHYANNTSLEHPDFVYDKLKSSISTEKLAKFDQLAKSTGALDLVKYYGEVRELENIKKDPDDIYKVIKSYLPEKEQLALSKFNIFNVFGNNEYEGLHGLNDMFTFKSKLTIDEQNLLYNYSISKGYYIGAYLRETDTIVRGHRIKYNDIDADSTKKSIKILDGIMKKSPGLIEDTVLYRGCSSLFFDGKEITQFKPGQIINDKAFVSTSFIKDKSYLNNDIIVEILAPKGTKGAYIESFVGGYDQQEFLLDRNLNFRVISEPIEIDRLDGLGRKQILLKVEIVPDEVANKFRLNSQNLSNDSNLSTKQVELNKSVEKMTGLLRKEDSSNVTVDLSKTSVASKTVDSISSIQESKQRNTILSKFKDTLSGAVDKVNKINYYRNQRKKLSSAKRFSTDFDILNYYNDGAQYLYHNLRSYYNMHEDDPNIKLLFDKYDNLPNYKKSVDEILKDFAWLHSIDTSHDDFLNQVVDGLYTIGLNSNNFNDNYISNFDYGLLDEGYMYSRVTGPFIGAYERGQNINFKKNSSNNSYYYYGDRENAQSYYNDAVKLLKYKTDAAVYLNMLSEYPDNDFLRGASSIDQAVANIDLLINQAPRLKEDIVLYRGADEIFCDNNKIDITSLKPGQIINDKATVSTSLLKSKAYSRDILLEILAPKGSKALYLESMVKGYGQQEVLLPRDTHFRVISEPKLETYIDKNGITRDRVIVQIEIVPEEEVKSLKLQDKKTNNQVINNKSINNQSINNSVVSSSNKGKNASNVINDFDFNVLLRGDSNITYDSYNRLFNSNPDGVSLNQFFDKMNRNGLIAKYEDSIVDIDYLYKGGEGPGVIHHDVSHVERVMLNAIYMGNELNITEGEMNLLIDAAKYHDVGVYAGHDYHAQRSAQAVSDNLSSKYMSSDLRMIQAIVEYHGLNDSQANFNMIIQKYHIESENVETVLKLSNILKDADAIDRTRFMRNLDTRYFRNKEVANSLVKTSYQMQEMYGKQNMDSLISRGAFDEQNLAYINQCRSAGVPDYVLYESFTNYAKWGYYSTPYEMINRWMGWSQK